MPVAIQLPALSPTMDEGRITKWLKKEGDKVSPGTALAECETDKSNLEIETVDGGTLLKILVPEGATAPVGATIAWIGKPGEAIPEVPAEPPAPREKAPASKPASSKPMPPVLPEPKPEPMPPSAAPLSASQRGERVLASPLAKRMALDQGIDIGSIEGSGPSGRIIKRDLEVNKGRSGDARGAPESIPLSAMRRAIAQRLGEVKMGVPHFYLTIDVEMDAALKLREEAAAAEVKISLNDVIVKATALAVRRFPRINQVFQGDHIQQLHAVDVGVAVAIEDGLITPMVRNADTKGIEELGAEIRELAARAKKRALRPEEYTGGSITVSNLGMFGIDNFIAIINPPQAAIIAVGRVEPRAVVRGGEVVIKAMMQATLSGDHRVIDGAVGARFLQEFKGFLEHPLRMTL